MFSEAPAENSENLSSFKKYFSLFSFSVLFCVGLIFSLSLSFLIFPFLVFFFLATQIAEKISLFINNWRWGSPFGLSFETIAAAFLDDDSFINIEAVFSRRGERNQFKVTKEMIDEKMEKGNNLRVRKKY
ncbi:hypothetical protein [Mycoplasma parvum]|uniref:hypothetical protein n=1 Tax=Mycoplasma parvum TaxID=984991 RepID=UPI001182DF42|nr:hypothetical protein [Mycoplasma parvum]